MSKAAASGGNLESILASIRRSLAEESTVALTDDAAATPPPPAPKVEPESDDAAAASTVRREGLAKRLAEASPVPQPQGSDDLSDLIVPSPEAFARFGPVVVPEPASEPEPAPPAEQAQPEPEIVPAAPPRADAGDPLWFLTPGPDQEAPKAAEPAAASNEPTLRPDVVRASLPPFFGSSVEADKAEVVTAPPPPVIAPRPSVAPAEPAPSPVRETAPPRPAPVVSVADPPAPAAQPLRNGRANSLFDPPPVETVVSTAAADLSSKHGLDAVVVDMLRPMLRQWLDENMPRLVASALAKEVSSNGRDPKTS